jgi:2-polyprenyl-3-methyl-5-hydroxy-6-metoxy-1,4-benzoquinol methylase
LQRESAQTKKNCWLCDEIELKCVKTADIPSTVNATAFRATDAHYGQCAAVYQCTACGFRQCSDFSDVLSFYQAMDDPDYEASRAPRSLQAERLLQSVRRYRPSGRLLDIGAGSGILVEAATRLGYRADGIEPSEWMVRNAAGHGLKIQAGILPNKEISGPYDVVTLVDVIEHVSDPIELLVQARTVLASDGIGVVITPDVSSVAARVMGKHWWHYRLAHICYFERKTLLAALQHAGLEPIAIFRPCWYFTADYLSQRLGAYLPIVRNIQLSKLKRTIVLLNLFDSLGIVFRPALSNPRRSSP